MWGQLRKRNKDRGLYCYIFYILLIYIYDITVPRQSYKLQDSSLSRHFFMANFLSSIVSDLSKLFLYPVGKISTSNQRQFLSGKQVVHLQ